MQCRLLIYFTILGFHLVLSYPKIQTNYYNEESQPVVKSDGPQNEKDRKLINESNIAEGGEEIYEARDGNIIHKTSENHHDTSRVIFDKELNSPESHQQHLGPENARLNQVRHKIYTMLRNLHSLAKYENHPEKHVSSTHTIPEPQVNKHRNYGYKDEYEPGPHTVNGYYGNPNVPKVSQESNDAPVKSQKEPQYESSLVGDPYYKVNEHEYYAHPSYGSDLGYNQGYGHIYSSEQETDDPILINSETDYEYGLEFPKTLHTATIGRTNDQYIDKYFKPEYIIPIRSTTNSPLQEIKLSKYSEPNLTPTPDHLKWVEHIEDNDTITDLLEKPVLEDTLNTEEAKDVTSKSKTVTDINNLDNVSHNDETAKLTKNYSKDKLAGIPVKSVVIKDTNLNHGTKGEFSLVTTTEPAPLNDQDNLGKATHGKRTESTENTIVIKEENKNTIPNLTKTKPNAETALKNLENVPSDSELNLHDKPIVHDENINHIIEVKNATIPTNKDKENKDNIESVVPGESTLDLDDIPQMKPTSEPLVWFRPDEEFWRKVQNGETTYDKVVFVQVRPTALIERHIKEFHHENGTVIKDHYEAFWDNEDDPSPKEITTKRVIEHPDGTSSIII